MATKFTIGQKVRVVRRKDGRLPVSRNPEDAPRIGRIVTIREIITGADYLGARHVGYKVHSRRGRDWVFASYELEPIDRRCAQCGEPSRTRYCSTACRVRFNSAKRTPQRP